MNDTIKFFAIKDPEGNFWKTPKGKQSWSTISVAKNSWSCHNHTKGPQGYWVTKKWSEDAEGWSVVKLKEYKLVEDTES